MAGTTPSSARLRPQDVIELPDGTVADDGFENENGTTTLTSATTVTSPATASPHCAISDADGSESGRS